MDTSETYIKMCGTAREIQLHKLEYGDWYYQTVLFTGVHYLGCFTGKKYIKAEEASCIWLPRQDQLQEMVFDKYRLQMPGFIINDLSIWCSKNLLAKYSSMEQLWLAFVMKEKYHKVWDGENWVTDR